jgi:dihydrofolate synthase/folylpolyglutamate synthase
VLSSVTLQQWLAQIEAGHPTEIELGLDRVAEVATRMQIDLSPAKVITVAGTNGKGSTTAMLESILRAGGYRTGVYTSPHFLRYNERIQLDGAAVSDQLICDAFSHIEQSRKEISLTYFEFGTLAALKVFADAKLDFVILEVGLGGRLDAVNIIDADLAILTSVALDHTDWLGDTLDQIGYEKAGIFRANRPALCGLTTPPESVIDHAAQIGAQLLRRGVDFDLEHQGDLWSWHGLNRAGECVSYQDLPCPDLPLINAPAVLQAVSLLAPNVAFNEIKSGLENARMTGRMQRSHFAETPVILDVAHNEEAARYLALRLQDSQIAGKMHLILGMLKDKDRAAVVHELSALKPVWHLVSLTGPRASTANELREFVKEEATGYDSVKEALEQIQAQLTPEDLVVVCGSFLTVTEALQWQTQQAN